MPLAGFTPGQRRAAIALVSLAIVINAVVLLTRRARIADPASFDAPRSNELVGAIDPNTADLASLAALPQMGQSRAEAVIAYRESRRENDPTLIVFKEPRDLLAVPGIGATMLEHLRPYLIFPDK